MDFRIRENDGRVFLLFFPWYSVFIRGKCICFAAQLAKNLYRKDAKDAKKQQTSLDFMFYFALFASSR